jgi:LacI family transcriptional regulator, galactose operon repressor
VEFSPPSVLGQLLEVLRMTGSRHVCLLIDTSMSWGVRIITGISRYAHEVGNWLIHVEPRGRYDRFRIPEGWSGDGILARINSKGLANEIMAADIPTVNVSWYPYAGKRIARCTIDEQATGRMAAEYFLAGGFDQFGYCGPLHRSGYTDELAKAFCDLLKKSGHACNVYRPARGDQRTTPWDAQLAGLVEWLRRLPRPVAVLAWSAARGRQVTEACHYAGIRVPDEVAVLGGEYDDLMSHISSPPLSTIDQPAEQVGYEAARLLDGMMQGKATPKRPVLLQPSRVVVRHSTDTLAIDDEMVRDACRLIRERARDGVRVSEVVREMAVARRALEQRFFRIVGRTLAAEIRRVRIEEAKRLLLGSGKSISEIARMAGFGHEDLLARVFRRGVGMTPSQFRRKYQREKA